MESRTYKITMTGVTPLLMHQQDNSWQEQVKKWQKDPANKQVSVAGDDRSPAWTWIGYLYQNAGLVAMPSDNLMTLIREGASRIIVKKNETFKRMSQSGIVVNEIAWPITVNGEQVPTKGLKSLIGEKDFEKHEQAATKLGFSLFLKPSKIGMVKHIRVRPRFDIWSCSGTATVFEEKITTDVLRQIFTLGGVYAGVCDWRPSSPKGPGPFGKFTAEIEEV
jgi:hypothetical protein